MKSPAVPYHYRSRAIIAFRNFSFEVGVVQRMIFDVYCQALVCVALGRCFRHGPGLQRPIDRQPEIVVQPRCPVLLNHERVAMLGPGADFQLWQFRLWQPCALRGRLTLDLTGYGFGRAGRLRRPIEAAFAPVFFKLGHGRILSHAVLSVAGSPFRPAHAISRSTAATMKDWVGGSIAWRAGMNANFRGRCWLLRAIRVL